MAENYDQIRQRSPFTTLDGTETITLNQGGVTKGGFLSVLKTWVTDSLSVLRAQISDATEFGRDLIALDDADDLNALIVHPTPYSPPAEATSGELELGVETDERMFSPNLIVEAIAFHTAPKNPASITESTPITIDEIGSILVCDALSAIDITLTTIVGLETGKFQIINLATTPVTLTPTAVTLIDSTGPVTDISVGQYGHIEVIYLGDDTWYVREQ